VNIAAKESFVLHDVSAFPIVRFETSRAEPGYAPQWIAEMSALLELGRPFVLVAGGIVKDGEGDRKARSLFLKARRAELARSCRAIIGVEPSAVARAARKAQAAVLAKAFGIEMVFVATAEEAMETARGRLADGRHA
jgi:hypothetical protein